VPFPRNPDFVGRSDDLDKLHAAFRSREPVGIRPAGLTGMGGIGKTQLAVEYVYRCQERNDYPGGIFWVNAAEPLAQGLAQVGARLRPDMRGESTERQLQAAYEELRRRPDALLVFDNVEDPAQLSRPVGTEPTPLTFGCPVLFTTRRRELGRFHAVELSVLPEGPALQLLLRHDCRQAVLKNEKHPERRQAEAICRLLGYLPLALELASAFLAEWPDVSLADYRKRLEQKGCLPTLDSEVPNLSEVNFQPIHTAAVAATLQTQWEVLKKKEDDAARLVFRTAGQFTEAAVIPTAVLGLFAGVPDVGGPGDPSPLTRALKRLHSARLVEELLERHVRLHPLVREFSAALTPSEETPSFRHECTCRVARAFEDFNRLEATVRADGIDALNQTLNTALAFASESDEGVRERLSKLLRLFRRECHHLREWDSVCRPTALAQQVLFRAVSLGYQALAARAEQRLDELAQPYLVLRWRTIRESPALVRILTGHQGDVSSVAYSPDGRCLVSGAWDKTVAVWDAETGQRLFVLTGHQGDVSSVAFSPDGRRIASGAYDHTVRVWDAQTGQRLLVLTGHHGDVSSVAFSPDGRRIASGAWDKTVAVWDAQAGQRLCELTGHHDEVSSVAYSPDGRCLVSGAWDKTVAVWDAETGQRLLVLTGHHGDVSSVAFSPDGRRLASGAYDHTVRVWDAQTGQRLLVLTGHHGGVNSVAFSPDGRCLVSGAWDKTVAVWDAETSEQLLLLTGHQDGVNSVAFSPDGRRLASGADDHTVAVWDAETGQRLLELTGHHGGVSSVAFSPDGRRIASGADDHTVGVWDAETGQRLLVLTEHQSVVRSVAFSPDGRRIASASVRKSVVVWDAVTGERLRELTGHQAPVSSVAFSPDGRRIASGAFDKTVAVWDAETGQRLLVLTGHHGGMNSVAFSPDGRRIASGAGGDTVAVWDTQSGERQLELTGHQGWVSSVAFSPDGRRIASASHDQTVLMWDAETGEGLATLALDGELRSVAWHPDSRFLVAGDKGGNVYLLDYRERGADRRHIASDWGRREGGILGRLLFRIRREIRNKIKFYN
jgi:WD40 repeat protein